MAMVMEAHAISETNRLSDGPGNIWRRLTLAQRFTSAAMAASLVSVVLLGTWVSRTLEENIIESAGAASAVYIGHFLAPHLQELAFGDRLSRQSIRALDDINHSVEANLRLHSMKVWLQDGRIIYSTNRDLVGQVYFHESLRRAWSGQVTTEFNQLKEDENFHERGDIDDLLEVYVPIYSMDSDKVIAVAEFYEEVEGVGEQLDRARWQTWIVTALLAGAMTLGLFSIVRDGSQTIQQQREALSRRVSELSDLLQQNERLRNRVKRGARQVVDDHERSQHQLGSELHDGPAQLIGLALLKLDQLHATGADAVLVRGVLSDALESIRNISAGLLLPEARDRQLKDALLSTIRDFERRTRTSVTFLDNDLPIEPPRHVVLCLCRVVQEGLTNAFRHADGKGQSVSIRSDGKSITVEICDEGPGISSERLAVDHKHLGLIGLRGRVESIGGTMKLINRPQGGTSLSACLPVAEEE